MSAAIVWGALAHAEDLAARLQTPTETVAGRTLIVPKLVTKLFTARAGKAAWSDADGAPTKAAHELVNAVRDAWRDGLLPADYHLETLELVVPEADLESPNDLESVVTRELLLTDAYLTLAEHLSIGRVEPSSVDIDWALKRKRVDDVKRLEEALRSGKIARSLRRLTPTDERYRQLKAALAKYTAMEAAGPFVEIDGGAPLKPGATGARVTQLRDRLAREKYVSADADGGIFDATMERAVKVFQSTRGIEPTGIVTAETLAALNVPIAELVRQLRVNLERLRWLPRQLGKKHIFVDVAGFKLVAFENGKPVLTMRIIVGDEYRRTPMIATKATSVVLNPYWIIPRGILASEILPKARKDPEYLANHDIRVYVDDNGHRREISPDEIDWSRARPDGLPYHFQGHSGANNPLGAIKIVLRNNYAVYLHGTSNPRLFRKQQRTLSHGCIRVENPVGLATFLLRGEWTRSKIWAEIAEELEQPIPLAASVPVYLWYRTSWIAESGQLHFRPDVYGWDSILAAAMEGKAPLVPVDLQQVVRGRRSAKRRR